MDVKPCTFHAAILTECYSLNPARVGQVADATCLTHACHLRWFAIFFQTPSVMHAFQGESNPDRIATCHTIEKHKPFAMRCKPTGAGQRGPYRCLHDNLPDTHLGRL